MGMIEKLLDAVATPAGGAIPATNLIEARLLDAKRRVESAGAAVRETAYQAELAPGDESASNLAAARRDLADANTRVADLELALSVAQDRAMTSAEQATRAEHARHIKALEQRLKSTRRHGKALSAHLDNASRSWMAIARQSG